MRKIPDAILPLPATRIGPNEKQTVSTRTEILFQPRRLVCARAYPNLLLDDYKIGSFHQFLSAGPVRLPTFVSDGRIDRMLEILKEVSIKGADSPTMAKILEEVNGMRDNFGGVAMHIGQTISFTLTNSGPEPTLFEGHIVGIGFDPGNGLPDFTTADLPGRAL